MRPHGTRARYVAGCDCLPCRSANALYAEQRARLTAYGRPTTDLVDAEPARRHVRALSAAGMGRRRVAELSGVPHGTVSRLLGHIGAPSRRIRPETAARLLAVQLQPAPHALVDGTGTRRRLQALVAVGWSQSRLAERIGWTPSNFTSLVHGRRARITAQTAAAVREVYAQLWDQRPADPQRALRYAERHRWAPPAAWDDETIDDPAAVPDMGERGARGIDLAEVDHLLGNGAHITEVARRMGRTVAAIETARRRAVAS